MSKKVVLCVPTIRKPHDACIASIKASIPLIVQAGWKEGFVTEIGNQYISLARAVLLKKALNGGADVIVFIDHDLSWDAGDLLKLIETEGDVVGGTYRYRRNKHEYMGRLCTDNNCYPIVRESDGAIKSENIPGGFMKITREAVDKLKNAYPMLGFRSGNEFAFDLFQHGAYGFEWYSEDIAFCRRWTDLKEPIWTVPNLNINHHEMDNSAVYFGNLHKHLLKPAKLPDGQIMFSAESLTRYDADRGI